MPACPRHRTRPAADVPPAGSASDAVRSAAPTAGFRRKSVFVGALVAVAAALASVPAAADSWAPFGKRRVADPSGDYYVVLEGSFRSGTFVYARRAGDSAPVTNAGGRGSDGDAVVRPGDTVLARGELAQLPIRTLVSSNGEGFALIDRYGGTGRGDAVAVFSGDGKRRHAVTLADLYDEETRETFTRSVSSVHWHSMSWLDDATESVLVYGPGGLRAVSTEAGTVRTGTHDDIRRGIGHADSNVAAAAVEIAQRESVPGLGPVCEAIVADVARPITLRLRAGALVGEGSEAAQELFRHAVTVPLPDDVDERDHRFAVERLGDVFGERALPMLRAALKTKEGWGASHRGFARMGAAAVPTLIEVLRDIRGSNDYRGGAAHALKRMDPNDARPALDALLDATGDPEEYVANAAVNAAIHIDEHGIAGRLVEILARGSTQDGRIAMYLRGVRHPEAAAALEKALPRHKPDSFDAKRIREALEFQREE